MDIMDDPPPPPPPPSSSPSRLQADDDWIKTTCRRLRENDLSLTQVDTGRMESVTDSDMRHLSDALRKNRVVSSLRFSNLHLTKEGALMMVPMLKNNNSTAITSLEFDDCVDENGHIPDALSIALFYNPSIQSLHMRCSWTNPASAFSLGFLCTAARHLTELRLCYNRIDLQAAKAIAQGLSANNNNNNNANTSSCSTLRLLDLTGNSLTDEAVAILAEGISGGGRSAPFLPLAETKTTQRGLEYLILDFNLFGDQGVAALSRMLKTNTSLKELHLFGNSVSAKGAESLASALLVNQRLQSLFLSFNQIGDQGAVALAKALTINTTLTKIWFPYNSIGAAGICAFADHLPRMKGLEQLNVGMLLDEEITQALTSALQYNIYLNVLQMEKPVYAEFEEEEDTPCEDDPMDFYLRLNRSGRRLLRHETTDKTSVPFIGLWPHVLARALPRPSNGAPDVLYYLLREKVDLIGRRR